MNSLSQLLRTRIEQTGAIPFNEFMHQALYHPQWGYYSAGLQKFGPQGDFITAPELTPLFGYTLARQCQSILSRFTQPLILEFGAGSGQLCIDILTELERMGSLPTAYHILEVSSYLQQRQKALISEHIPHLAARVHWLDRWPTTAFQGIILANEVLDAMPVHRFLQTDEGLMEGFITLDANDAFCEQYRPIDNPRLDAYLQRALPELTLPYQSEANLFIDEWIAACSNMLAEGAMILIDYGFPRHEYYHSEREQGTLMCHYQHRAHSNPLLHIGEQDITAHVDFTHIAEAALAANLEIAGFTNQAAFLLSNGLLSFLETMDDSPAAVRDKQAVKQLVQPQDMGELFKVIALTKHLDMALTGFQLHDKRASL